MANGLTSSGVVLDEVNACYVNQLNYMPPKWCWAIAGSQPVSGGTWFVMGSGRKSGELGKMSRLYSRNWGLRLE